MIRKVSAEDIAIRGNGTGLEYMCPTWHFVYIFFNPVFQVSTAKNEINLFNNHILIVAPVTFAPAGAMTPSAEFLFSLYIYIGNFKNLIVRNHWTNFNITWQKCFLGTLYQYCSSNPDLSKTMPPRGRCLFSLYIYTENLKNFLIRNQWSDCSITWQECFFGDPLPRLFKPSWFIKKHGCWGAGLIFPIYLYRKL